MSSGFAQRTSGGTVIRMMKPEELDSLPQFWSDDVGIPMEISVLKRWHVLDPEAFRVAADRSGKIIGMVCVTKQTDSLFVIGYLGVAKAHQQKGIARLLLANATKRNPSANFALSASSDKLDIFFRRGFQKVETTYAYAYIGKFSDRFDAGVKPASLEVVKVVKGDATSSMVAAYDQSVSGFKRDVDILYFSDPAAVVIAVKLQGKIVGVGKMQFYLLGGGWLGPVYANDSIIARWLVDGLLRSFQNRKCPYLFTIISDQARGFIKSLSLKFTDKLTRCYLKTDANSLPPMNLNKVFAFEDPGFALV